MRRTTLMLSLLLAALAGSACREGTPWSNEEEAPTAESRHDFGPTAVYERRLYFLTPGDDRTTGAIFDFSSLNDSTGVRGGVRARVLGETGWVALADTGWALGPMREPWRILPRGPIRLIVSDAGELTALAVRDEPGLRLEPGPILAETSPDAGTQLVLRQAVLVRDDEPIPGVVLDAQLGRAIRADRAPAPADTASSTPTPIARPSTDAFLANAAGYHVVLSRSGDGDMAWTGQEGRTEIRRGVVLEPTAWSGAEGASPATAWAVRGPGADLAGELSTEAVDHTALLHLQGVAGLDYVLVSGWIEDRGVRRDVVGLVRHVR